MPAGMCAPHLREYAVRIAQLRPGSTVHVAHPEKRALLAEGRVLKGLHYVEGTNAADRFRLQVGWACGQRVTYFERHSPSRRMQPPCLVAQAGRCLFGLCAVSSRQLPGRAVGLHGCLTVGTPGPQNPVLCGLRGAVLQKLLSLEAFESTSASSACFPSPHRSR